MNAVRFTSHSPVVEETRLLPKEPGVIRMGVPRVEEPHHRGGYRELRSQAEMRKLLNRKIVEQDRKCALCHEEFTDYSDIVPDHKESERNGRRVAG